MQTEDQEIKKKVEDFNKRLKESALGINFIQPEWKAYFIELAKEEYGNDYGVTLKELCKLHKGFFPTGHEEIESKIDILAEEIVKLHEEIKVLKESKEAKGIKRADGTIR